MNDVREHLAGARVLVVGDVMLDEHVWGHVRRISPEAPVPVVEVSRRTHVPGAAANTAAGVAALAGRSMLAGVVGQDAEGRLLLGALEDAGIDVGAVVVTPSRRTTTKTRVIAQGQQIVRVDEEDREPLGEDVARSLLALVEERVPDADVVVVSDYGKGVLTPGVLSGVIEAATSAGKAVVVDPKGDDYSRYRGATVVTPNIGEAKRAAGIAGDAFAELAEVASRLAEVLPDTSLLITRGSEGMTLLHEGRTLDVPVDAREVYDVTGAGDVVVAALAVALARDIDMDAAVRLANTAAGIAVGKLGTASVTLEELADRAGLGGPPLPS